MAETGRVAIVAALEREVWPLVKNWPRNRKTFDDRNFEFFEQGGMVVVCGGIGVEAARRAAEAVIQLYDPAVVISAGFAGALNHEIQVGQVIVPRTVINVNDGSRTDTGSGAGVLVTHSVVADAAQKAKLAQAFGAQAVDMEASAVARAAETHGLRFMAYKAISDASEFSMPDMTNFFGADGKLKTANFALHVVSRPWLWSSTFKLARDSAQASKALCKKLAALTEMKAAEPAFIPETAGAKS